MFPGFKSPLLEGKFDDLANVVARVEVSNQSIGARVILVNSCNKNNLPTEFASLNNSTVF